MNYKFFFSVYLVIFIMLHRRTLKLQNMHSLIIFDNTVSGMGEIQPRITLDPFICTISIFQLIRDSFDTRFTIIRISR